MSIKVATRVWEHSKLRGTQKLVLLALADFANDAGLCWPSTATLAGRVGESERYTREIIAQLVASGDLIRRAGGGRGKVSRYGVATGLDSQQREKLNHALQNSVSENTDTETPAPETLHSGDGNPALQCHETLHYSDGDEGANSAVGSPETPRSAGGIRHIDPSENQKSTAPAAADAAPSPPASGKKPKAERKPRTRKQPEPEPTPEIVRRTIAKGSQVDYDDGDGPDIALVNVIARYLWDVKRLPDETPEALCNRIKAAGRWIRQTQYPYRGSEQRMPPSALKKHWQGWLDSVTPPTPATNGRRPEPVPYEDEEPVYAAQQRRAALLAQAREQLKGSQP